MSLLSEIIQQRQSYKIWLTRWVGKSLWNVSSMFFNIANIGTQHSYVSLNNNKIYKESRHLHTIAYNVTDRCIANETIKELIDHLSFSHFYNFLFHILLSCLTCVMVIIIISLHINSVLVIDNTKQHINQGDKRNW